VDNASNEVKSDDQTLKTSGCVSSSPTAKKSSATSTSSAGSTDVAISEPVAIAGDVEAEASTVDLTKFLALVEITIKDNSGNPLANIDVELHSEPQTARTDTNGVARFRNVERGMHTIKISYGGKLIERSLDLSTAEVGLETKNIALNIALDAPAKQSSTMPIFYGLAVIVIILSLLALLRSLSRKNKAA
jgi:hypothetical protein